jgi:RNA polymerase sigma factor (sigma-70 family)
MTGDDISLLRDFAIHRTETAFFTLVQRHLGLVHSAALRQTGGDAHLAEEIAQKVFILLAQKAGRLGDSTILSAWLYRATLYTAADTLKQNRRRQQREQEAFMQSTQNQSENDAAWKQIAPLLDEAMGALREADRNAVLLRYFEDKPLAEVGIALGVSEDAARVRMNRALEKLRSLLTKRGVALGATAIAGAVTTNAVTAAPVTLAAAITTAALAGTALTLTTVAVTTLQKITVTAALTVTIGAGIFEARQAHEARTEAARLQAQQAPMQEQIQKLQNDLSNATTTMAGLKEDFAKNQKDNSELLKLRGEIGVLKNQLAAVKSEPPIQTANTSLTVSATPHKPGQYIPVSALSFVGYDSPEAALESFKWAMIKGTLDQANDAIPPDQRDKEISQKMRDDFAAMQSKLAPKCRGFQIMEKKVLNETNVEFKVRDDMYTSNTDGSDSGLTPLLATVPVLKYGDEWKTGGAQSYSPRWETNGDVETFSQ